MIILDFMLNFDLLWGIFVNQPQKQEKIVQPR